MEKLGLSAASLPEVRSISESVKLFISCFERFGNLDEAGHQLRGRTWKTVDVNGNGHVSLAEVGQWIQTTLLHLTHNKKLYREFYPSYIRSFKDAADINGSKRIKGTALDETDLLEIGEFRLFTVFLCLYALIFDAFRFLDGSFEVDSHHQSVFAFSGAASTDTHHHGAPHELTGVIDEDRRITLVEFRMRHAGLAGSPFIALARAASVSGEEAIDEMFRLMDEDGKGAVLLSEFCAFIKKSEILAGTEIGRILSVGE